MLIIFTHQTQYDICWNSQRIAWTMFVKTWLNYRTFKSILKGANFLPAKMNGNEKRGASFIKKKRGKIRKRLISPVSEYYDSSDVVFFLLRIFCVCFFVYSCCSILSIYAAALARDRFVCNNNVWPYYYYDYYYCHTYDGIEKNTFLYWIRNEGERDRDQEGRWNETPSNLRNGV